MQWVEQAADVVPRARQSQPVAITLDLLLKDEMAWPVLKHLKADPQTRDIPVVIVSILDEQPTSFALGASAYLTKPLARQELLDTLQRVVAPGGPGDAGELPPVRRVLAVDDQPAALELIALALEGSPYQVLPATTGAAALELLQGSHMQGGERPDVLIVDLMMA